MRGFLTTGLLLLQVPALAHGLAYPLPEAEDDTTPVIDQVTLDPSQHTQAPRLTLNNAAVIASDDDDDLATPAAGHLKQELAELRALKAQLARLEKEVLDRQIRLANITGVTSPQPPSGIADCDGPVCVVQAILRKAKYAAATLNNSDDDDDDDAVDHIPEEQESQATLTLTSTSTTNPSSLASAATAGHDRRESETSDGDNGHLHRPIPLPLLIILLTVSIPIAFFLTWEFVVFIHNLRHQLGHGGARTTPLEPLLPLYHTEAGCCGQQGPRDRKVQGRPWWPVWMWCVGLVGLRVRGEDGHLRECRCGDVGERYLDEKRGCLDDGEGYSEEKGEELDEKEGNFDEKEGCLDEERPYQDEQESEELLSLGDEITSFMSALELVEGLVAAEEQRSRNT